MDKSLFQLWNFQRLHTIYIWPYKYRQNSLVSYCLDQNWIKQFLFVATISEMGSASLLSFSIARNAVWHQVELLYTWTLRHATCRLNYAKVPSRPKTSSVLEGKEMSKVIWCALYKIAFTVYKNNVIHNTCSSQYLHLCTALTSVLLIHNNVFLLHTWFLSPPLPKRHHI